MKQTAWSLVYVIGWSAIIPGFLEWNLMLTCYLTVSVISNCSKRWYWTHSIITHIESFKIYFSKNPSFCFKISSSLSKYMKTKNNTNDTCVNCAVWYITSRSCVIVVITHLNDLLYLLSQTSPTCPINVMIVISGNLSVCVKKYAVRCS